MAITEDASTPAIVQVSGSAGSCTTASFSPPAGTLLVALVAGGYGTTGATTAAITDSTGGTWTAAVTATGTNSTTRGVAKIFYRYLATAPGAMTVTATFTNLAGGQELAVRVLSGAASNQAAAAVATQINSTNTTAGTVSITTTVTGSWVYGISDDPGLNDSYTVTTSPATSILSGGDYNNTVDQVRLVAWKAAAATGTPGATTLGGTWSGATRSNMAAFEVLPFTSTTFAGATALAAVATLTTAVTLTEQAATTLLATASLSGLTASVTEQAATPLAGVSSVTADGTRIQSAAVAMTAVSTVVAGPFLAEFVASTLSAMSALTVDGRTVKVSAAGLSATSTLTASAAVGPSTQLFGIATLTSTAGQTEAAAVALSGVASLSPAAGLVAQAAVTLPGTSAMTASVTTAAGADLIATSGLNLGPQLTELAVAALVATGSLSGTAQLVEVAQAALSGSSVLTTGSPLLITGGTGAILVSNSSLTAAAISFVPTFVWPTGPVVRVVKTPSYRLYVANTRTGRIGWELPFISVSWNTPINATGTLRATLPIESTLDVLHKQGALDPRTTLREVLTGPYRFSLVLVFGDAAIFAGPYLPAVIPADKPTVDIGAAELIGMLDKRLLYTPGSVAMADPSADLILGPTSGPGLVKAIIDAATNGLGRELPITCTSPPDLRGNEQRLFYGFDLTTAGSALSQLTAQGLQNVNQPVNQTGGPDYRLDPYLRQAADGLYVSWELRIGNPYLGANIAPWIFDDATSLISQEIDASKMASTYYVPGSGTDRLKMISVVSDSSLITKGWPALEEVDGSHTSELDPVRLKSYATGDLARYLQPVDKWTIRAKVDTEPQLGSFRVGDPILLDIQRHPVIDPGVYARRITDISGDVSSWVSLSSIEARPEL